MRDCVRELCLLSIFCGAALSLCPEGGVKRLLRLLSTVALLALVLQAVHSLDLSAYPLDLARYREREQALSRQGEQAREELSRLVIEREYAAYILDKAAALGLAPRELRIGVRWTAEGVWVPESSSMGGVGEADRARLSSILEAELGIPAERQEWLDDGG